MPACFLRRDTKGVDPIGRGGGEVLEGVGRGEAVIRICHMKYLFPMKEK